MIRALKWDAYRSTMNWSLRGQYVVAITVITLGFAGQWALESVLGSGIPRVAVGSAVVALLALVGPGPAMTGAALDWAGTWFFFVPEPFSFRIATGADAVNLSIYGIFFAAVGAAAWAAGRRRQQIDEARETLRVSLASIGDAVIATDTAGRVTFLNAVATELTGWSAAEAVGSPIDEVFNIINESTREKVLSPVARVLKEGRTVGLANHTTLISRNGSEVPVDDSAAPIRGRDGSLNGVIMVFRDVTARRRMEKQLRRSERNLSDFFDNANVGLHVVGPTGTVLRANNTEMEMLGYTREEYLGHHIAEFHADQPVIEEILERLTSGESLQNFAARLRCKDGSIREVLINSSALFEDGEFIHSRCVTRDVTELNRAQEHSALLASIVGSSDDAIVSKSLDGIIQSWNGGAEKIFGFTAAEAVGAHISLIIPSNRLDEEDEIIRQIRAGNRMEHFESIRVRKDGRQVPVSLTISPVRDKHGNIVGASKISRDITVRQQTEEALAQYQRQLEELVERRTTELQSAYRALENSRGDLRKLTARITDLQEEGYSKLAGELHDVFGQHLALLAMQVGSLTNLAENPSDEFIERSRLARQEIERLSKEIHELARQLHPSILDDLGLAAAVRELCESFAETFGIKPTFALSGPEGVSLPKNVELCLYRVAQESLTNIRKHSDAKSVEVSLMISHDAVVLTVRDDGKGFDPSGKGDDGKQSRLGLVGIKERVGQIGGTIDISSTVGKGAVVEARAPLGEAQ